MKCTISLTKILFVRSPSSRGRGLKSTPPAKNGESDPSPSSRGRGLKYRNGLALVTRNLVALFTRAWIEMKLGFRPFQRTYWSPSSRGRGLKYGRYCQRARPSVSPSSRGRGLKSIIPLWANDKKQSPSSRGRGLK